MIWGGYFFSILSVEDDAASIRSLTPARRAANDGKAGVQSVDGISNSPYTSMQRSGNETEG